MNDLPPSPAAANLFDPQCPSRAFLALISGKWALLVIHTLAAGPARTAVLRRRIAGISEKMLIQTLRQLERHGLVSRHAWPEVPPRVEYALTPLGASVSEPVRALDLWVERHAADIIMAQRRFDQDPFRESK